MTRNQLTATWAHNANVRERLAWRAGFMAGALFLAAVSSLIGLMMLAL